MRRNARKNARGSSHPGADATLREQVTKDMSAEHIDTQWDRIDELYDQALSLPPEQVVAFCTDACGDDEVLRQFLLDLVGSTVLSDDAIRQSISALARDVAGAPEITGERVGAYRIEKLLARGGMGEVYLASRADGEFEKSVVVKVVRNRLNRDEFVRHFRTERQVLANLSHPYIPALVDAGQLEDGRPYFIAEYVDGTPIDAWCDTQKLSIDRRISLVLQVAAAVQHAHSNLVLHLDIKPENILIAADGTPRLLDFGVARLIDERDQGHKAFTPEYASPEQLRGESPTVASDVYSMGVLMYRLLAGELPFSSPRFSPAETKLAEREHLDARVRKPESLPDVDRDLRAIVRKSMAEAVADRYSSVEALLADLERYRNRRPVEAVTPTLSYRAGKFARRNTIAIAVVAGVFVLLAAFAVRETSLRKEAQAAHQRAEQEAETSRQVSRFMTELFEVSDPGEARGNSVTARELLDRGAERIGTDLEDQPFVAARMMSTMGSVYVKLGLYDAAAPLLEEARSLREATLSAEDVDLAAVLTQLGDVYRRLARFDEAEAVLERSLAIHEQQVPTDRVELAETLQTLGNLYMRQGRFDDAEQAHLRGIPIHERVLGPEHPDFASHLSSLAMVYADRGRNDEAEAHYLRAIGILERAWGPDHPDLANYLESLGNLYNSLARYDESAAYLERGLALRESALESDHPLISYSLMNLSALFGNSGDLDKAEAYIARAIRIQEKAFDADDYRLALSRYNLGDTLLQRGRLDEAAALAHTALDSWSKTLEPDHPFIGYANRLLGQVYMAQGLNDQAEPHVMKAYSVFGQRPPDDPWHIKAATAYAEWLRAAGRDDEADAVEAQLGAAAQ